MNRQRLAAIAGCVALAMLVVGCDSGDDLCSQAQQRVSRCSPGTILRSCSPDRADLILSATCDDIARAASGRATASNTDQAAIDLGLSPAEEPTPLWCSVPDSVSQGRVCYYIPSSTGGCALQCNLGQDDYTSEDVSDARCIC
jgi:hypothetical protein